MPAYREWTLPLNPPNPYNVYLHSLALLPSSDKVVAYTKYILGVIGVLELADPGKVNEWTYPAALLTSTMVGSANLTHIESDATSSLWAIAESFHGALVQFVPKTGTFIRYTTPKPNTPLIAPADLKFDDEGMLWFVGGSIHNLSTISRFDPATAKVTSWEIPLKAMLNVRSIYPNRQGTSVWVSSVDANLGSTRQWIGRLEVASNTLSCFAPDPYNNDSPRSICIRLQEDQEQVLAVWFTAAATHGPDATVPGIYRTDASGAVFSKYETTNAAWPRYIALDLQGTAWVTDIAAASLVRCDPRLACSDVRFKRRNFELKRSEQRLEKKSARVKPVVSIAPLHAATVSTTRHPCTVELKSAPMQMPDHIRCMAGKEPGLLFVNWGTNKIGQLTP